MGTKKQEKVNEGKVLVDREDTKVIEYGESFKNDLIFVCVDCRGKGCKECKFTGEVVIEDDNWIWKNNLQLLRFFWRKKWKFSKRRNTKNSFKQPTKDIWTWKETCKKPTN